jgi:hypothetical protein
MVTVEQTRTRSRASGNRLRARREITSDALQAIGIVNILFGVLLGHSGQSRVFKVKYEEPRRQKATSAANDEDLAVIFQTGYSGDYHLRSQSPAIELASNDSRFYSSGMATVQPLCQ